MQPLCSAMIPNRIISLFRSRSRNEMTNDDIIVQLRLDPGTRTIGELIQERAAAAHKILQLQAENDRLRGSLVGEPHQKHPDQSSKQMYRAGTLINLKQVCESIGLSRSTVYKRVSDGTFPPPLRVGLRSVRWEVKTIEDWRNGLTHTE